MSGAQHQQVGGSTVETARPARPARKLLSVQHLASGYGHVGVLEDVVIDVHENEIVTLLGSNGAGKSTLLKTISGLLPVQRGSIRFDGTDIGSLSPRRIVDVGVLQVAEGRRLFRSQTVARNLDLGLYGAGIGRAEEKERLNRVHSLFPILQERRASLAGALSGGQQQMLAIGQALMRSPRLLMLDEPSLGLAPVIVDQVMDVLLKLRAAGCAILLVEQLVERALAVADIAYVMRTGRMLGHAPASTLHGSALVTSAYM